MPELHKKELQGCVQVTGSVAREKHFRRRFLFNKGVIAGLVAIATVQVFVGLPTSLPLPLWGAALLAAGLFVASLALGFFAVETVRKIERYIMQREI